ncbi:hypothetical protein ACQ1Q5_00095 [Ornithobacterium rhinotracheale]
MAEEINNNFKEWDYFILQMEEGLEDLIQEKVIMESRIKIYKDSFDFVAYDKAMNEVYTESINYDDI